jgi:hypothetical protein
MNGFRLALAIHLVFVYAEVILALIALILLAKQHALKRYKSLSAILVVLFSGNAFGLLSSHLHPANRHLLPEIYFYMCWSGLIVEPILMLIFCYGVLAWLFSSLPKLRSITTRVFGWILFLWCAGYARFFFTTHISTPHLIAAGLTQLRLLEAGISLLTAMVVFICIQPLGLGLRSCLPAFGLGLIFSALGIFSDPLFLRPKPQQYNWMMVIGSVAVCAQLISWVTAISWSEPVRPIVAG